MQSLSAKNSNKPIPMPRMVFVAEVSCELPAPSNFNIDAIGPDWVKVSWSLVPGAAQYRELRGDPYVPRSPHVPVHVPTAAVR